MSPETVERRRAVLINVAYIALVLGAFYLFMKYAFWTVAPFIFAFVLAVALQRPTNFLSKKTHIKKGIVSVIAVLLIIALLVTLIALVGARVVTEAKGLASTLGEWLKKLPDYVKGWEESLYRLAERLPGGLKSSVEEAIKSLSDKLLLSSEERAALRTQNGESSAGINLLSLLKPSLSGVWSTAKQIPSILVGMLLFIIAACFMTAGYDGIVGFIKNQLTPQKRRTLSKTKKIVVSSMGKLVKSYALIMLVTFFEMLIGLGVLKIIGVYKSGYIFIIAIITAIVDILPVLGTGTVVIPWAVFSLINKSYGLGIGLLVIYACITVIRQIIEPKIVANNLGIPAIVSIMGMYIGVQLFGFIGIFIMPIMITVLKVLNDDGVIHIWRSSKKAAAQDAPAPTADGSEGEKEPEEESKEESETEK